VPTTIYQKVRVVTTDELVLKNSTMMMMSLRLPPTDGEGREKKAGVSDHSHSPVGVPISSLGMKMTSMIKMKRITTTVMMTLMISF